MQLNYFPIKIDFEKYQINREKYSEERLSELRKEHNHTHSFFRNGDYIYISDKNSQIETPLGELTEKSTFGDSQITSSLIKHIFFRTFKERFPEYIPTDFYPFRFFSSQEKDDIIFTVLPIDLRGKIAYKKLIEVQLRLTKINGKSRFGFIINIRRNWVFTKSCAELSSEKFDLIGTEVLRAEISPTSNNVLAPNEEVIGRIIKIENDEAEVETNEGIQKIKLIELFIFKSKLNIGNYLTFATCKEKSDEILNIIETKRTEFYDTKNLYQEILKIAKLLFLNNGVAVNLQNKDGFSFTVEPNFLEVENSISLQTPTFIFDPAATKTTNINPDIGLTNFGPYDNSIFDTKTVNILCICHKNSRGYFTHFLSSLKDGLPQSDYFKKGLLKKYDLQNITFDIKEIQEYKFNEYVEAIKKMEVKQHLAIIEIPSEFKKLDVVSNPYYQIKAKLLTSEIPVQCVVTEKIKKYDQYILNAISLQIYAKLGGIPWVLPSQRSVDKEIIIGIGHSVSRQNAYKGAKENKIVGITTFFSGDGQYLISDRVKEVIFEDYFEELLKSLKNSIKTLSKEQGWSENDTVRLIFHIFKPIKNTEFDVISKLIKEIPEYKIKFAFVTISKKHPNLLFDTKETGTLDSYAKIMKGIYIPKRASNISLDAETCIVQMFGAKELKTPKQRISTPIQIKIRIPQGNYENNELSDLLYYDLNYITQQIFAFTYLSWKSFLPSEKPATMLYSDLISNLLGKMRTIPTWDADILNYSLKRKKWFL